jgi:phosphoribosylformylglycinamidine synthase
LRVYYDILPKPQLHDPQGEALQRVLQRLGVMGIGRVYVGKRIVLEIEGRELDEAPKEEVEQLGKRFFSNPLLEDVVCYVENDKP